ncbi:MAG TPA: helix-hairpin-helix domain-containing protein [Oscillatoriales cyanobacterium M59_W2019_021]|nr:helix-hairpin-helix domain-containing protein [Oscillatoriales cyanobacterium M4454_W2019_049]HIK52940.1 helix-hairpin-helix domain-containing protein [Oscillatoriales cyanobacterium M59_W2019_021]
MRFFPGKFSVYLLTPCFCLLSACRQEISPQIQPLPQDPGVKVYFNQNQATRYTEDDRNLTRPGDNLEALIVEMISKSQTRVDVAVQELRLPEIARALADRHRSGVKVRVIIENSYRRPWSDYTDAEIAQMPERERDRAKDGRRRIDTNGDGRLSPAEIRQNDALVILRDTGVPLLDDTADGSKGSGLMHHKFIVTDDRSLLVTSANFTGSDIHGDPDKPASRGNANNLLRIDSPQLAAIFRGEFNVMWGDGVGGKPDSQFGVQKPPRGMQTVVLGNNRISVQFSPTSRKIPWEQSVNGTISKTLTHASQSADLALFVFSEQGIADTLAMRHQQGISVRALIDPSFAYRDYSEGLDLLGVALPNRNCQYEAGNRPWQQAIETVGVPLLPPGDKLHHKFAVLDSRITITGSHNWSAAANQDNDETLLIVENSTVAAHFQREFDRLYTHAKLGIPEKVRQKIKQQNCPAIVQKAPTPTQTQKTIPSSSDKINLNTATPQELETLPGVGPKLAREIAIARQEKPFTSLEDLDRVPGIGSSKLEKLRDRVTW